MIGKRIHSYDINTNKQAVPDKGVVGNSRSSETSSSSSLPVNLPVPQEDKRLIVIDEPVIVKDVTPVKKEPFKKIQKNDIVDHPDLVVEKSDPAPVPVKSVPEKKDVLLKNDVTIKLALKSSPNMHETRKTEQQVSFSVIEPVYYSGVLIIRQGATAKGSLTIGSRRTDIKIDQVEAINGNFISIKSESPHGRRDDIEDRKTFTAVIREGTSIRF